MYAHRASECHMQVYRETTDAYLKRCYYLIHVLCSTYRKGSSWALQNFRCTNGHFNFLLQCWCTRSSSCSIERLCFNSLGCDCCGLCDCDSKLRFRLSQCEHRYQQADSWKHRRYLECLLQVSKQQHRSDVTGGTQTMSVAQACTALCLVKGVMPLEAQRSISRLSSEHAD